MKAVVIHAPGAPEQLVIADMPEPVPGPGEVLVDVAFAGCNWADTQVRTGIYPHARSYPLVLGLEISGTVSKLGPGVGNVQIGDRVAAFLEQGGAYAQKAVVRANMLMALPEAIPLDVGAALTVQPLTGYHMLHTIYGIEPGETVLINAIGGGVGLFTTQLAVKAGARVIGTVGTPGKEKRALEYGAERVVVTTQRGFRAGGSGFHQRPRCRSRHQFARCDDARSHLQRGAQARAHHQHRRGGGSAVQEYPRTHPAALANLYPPAYRPCRRRTRKPGRTAWRMSCRACSTAG